MWHKAIWKGHPVRLELTRVGLLVQLANHYTTRGAIVEGDPKSPFSIATKRRCRGGCYSFFWIVPLYPWSVPYNAECKARSHHVPFFFSLWYNLWWKHVIVYWICYSPICSEWVWVSSRPYFTGITFKFSSTTNPPQILQARKTNGIWQQRTLRNKQFNNHNKQDKNN